jgi:hypothetical protein
MTQAGAENLARHLTPKLGFPNLSVKEPLSPTERRAVVAFLAPHRSAGMPEH